MLKPHRLAITLAAVAGFALSLPAAAQFAKKEDAVKYRRAAFTMMGAHMGRLNAMVKGDVPFDAAAAAANADIIATMSRLPFTGFVDGTSGTEKGTAKAKIWTERAKFDDGARKMIDEAAKLQAAAKTGNADQIKAAFGNTGKTCKSCHDEFRND